MLTLVYFLAFCRVSLILTAGFLFTTFLTVVLLVTLYFRSVKSAFDATLKAVRVIGREVCRDRIVHVLVNLLDNAAKVTEEGFVEIAAGSRPEGGVELSVRDTGPGIPREERDLVFERFHQAHGRTGGRHPASGSGLGLAVCREIIKHYGGRISVESEPGRGSCFVVTLPPGCTAPADPTKAFSRRQGVKREEKTYAAEDSDYR